MKLFALTGSAALGLAAAVVFSGCGNSETAAIGTVGPAVKADAAAVGGGGRGDAPSNSKRSGRSEAPPSREARK